MIRACLTLAVLGLLASVSPLPARAADPPLLGASLGSTRDSVVVYSTATVPTLVELTAPDGWQLAESSFRMAPGERHVVNVTREGSDGLVTMHMVALDLPKGMDTSALVLSVGIPKPQGPAWGLIALLALCVVLSGAWGILRRHRATR